MSSSITSRYSITSSGGTRLLATSARLSLRKQPDRGSQHERSGRTETVYESGSTPLRPLHFKIPLSTQTPNFRITLPCPYHPTRPPPTLRTKQVTTGERTALPPKVVGGVRPGLSPPPRAPSQSPRRGAAGASSSAYLTPECVPQRLPRRVTRRVPPLTSTLRCTRRCSLCVTLR